MDTFLFAKENYKVRDHKYVFNGSCRPYVITVYGDYDASWIPYRDGKPSDGFNIPFEVNCVFHFGAWRYADHKQDDFMHKIEDPYILKKLDLVYAKNTYVNAQPNVI